MKRLLLMILLGLALALSACAGQMPEQAAAHSPNAPCRTREFGLKIHTPRSPRSPGQCKLGGSRYRKRVMRYFPD